MNVELEATHNAWGNVVNVVEGQGHVELVNNPERTMQAPRAWYYFGRILFKTSTPLHQMGFLECQIEHLRKILFYFRIERK